MKIIAKCTITVNINSKEILGHLSQPSFTIIKGLQADLEGHLKEYFKNIDSVKVHMATIENDNEVIFYQKESK